MDSFVVESDRVKYDEKTGTLLADYDYNTSAVQRTSSGKLRVVPTTKRLTFKTDCKLPRVGCMMVGWGGNNGSTVTAAILANKLNVSWRTKEGKKVSVVPHPSPKYLTFFSKIVRQLFWLHNAKLNY